MKLVKVNARVTFVVWILETCANISVLIVWVFVYGTTSFGTLTNSMIWYYIVISYTFLMNTSYNKDRIIEDGWKFVILNSIKSIFHKIHEINNYCNSSSSQTDGIQDQIKGKLKNKQFSNQTEENDKENAPTVSILAKTTSCHNASLVQSSSTDIFTISNPEIERFPISHTSKFVLEDLNTLHIAKRNTSLEDRSATLSKGLSTDSESISDGGNRPLSYRIQIGREILSEMLKCLGNENAYIHYFRQLLDFEERIKSGLSSSSNEFKIEQFICNPSAKRFKVKNERNRVHNKTINERMAKGNKTSKIDFANDPKIDQRPLGEIFIKKQLRMHTLNNFTSILNNEDEYSNFVNNLINLEEGLINDN